MSSTMKGRTTSRRRCSTLVFAGLVVACTSSCRRRPTYYQEVAPILAARCVSCHGEGSVSTPRLGTYAEASAAAAKIALAVRTRDMPPWGADNSGQCRTWHAASWLPDADVRTLVDWAEGSHAEGDASQRRPASIPPPPAFGPVGAVAAMNADYTPGLGPLAYRCFIVDPDLAQDQLIGAFRVVSSEPRSVEQVTLYALDSQESELAATKLDD